MSTLPEYAGDRPQDKSVRIGSRNWMPRNRAWIREAEAERPGAADTLRAAALEELNSPEADRVSRGLAVLAVIGIPDDVPVLRRVTARGSVLDTEARAAIKEIESRAAAGRDPLQMLKGPTFRTRLIRAVAGLLGTGSVALGSVGLVRVLFHPSRFSMMFIFRGLAVLGFGIWLLWIARRGKLPHEEA